MPAIPPFLLKKLYVKSSLRRTGDGFALDLTNPIASGVIQEMQSVELDGAPVSLELVAVVQPDGQARPAGSLDASTPLSFPQGATFTLQVAATPLGPGDHRLTIRVVVQDVGPLEIPVADRVD